MRTVMLIEITQHPDGDMRVAFAPQGPAVSDKDTEDDAVFSAAVAGICLLAREVGLEHSLREVQAACEDVME